VIADDLLDGWPSDGWPIDRPYRRRPTGSGIDSQTSFLDARSGTHLLEVYPGG
jgi:hypothetical protein